MSKISTTDELRQKLKPHNISVELNLEELLPIALLIINQLARFPSEDWATEQISSF